MTSVRVELRPCGKRTHDARPEARALPPFVIHHGSPAHPKSQPEEPPREPAAPRIARGPFTRPSPGVQPTFSRRLCAGLGAPAPRMRGEGAQPSRLTGCRCNASFSAGTAGWRAGSLLRVRRVSNRYLRLVSSWSVWAEDGVVTRQSLRGGLGAGDSERTYMPVCIGVFKGIYAMSPACVSVTSTCR